MDKFFRQNRVYAVAGASTNPAKFGNKIAKWYQTHGISVVPINPKGDDVLGIKSVKSVTDVPVPPNYDLVLSVVTPPEVTKQLIADLSKAQGPVKSLWLQPGTHNPEVVTLAQSNVPYVITDCILVQGDWALGQSKL